MSDEQPGADSAEPAKASRKSVLLRLDPGVHEALAQWAADDLRSLNAHIEMLLRDALRRSGREVKARPIRRPGRPPKEG
ncbi:toxin-antitoxin system HicB family antitoxin [Tessaracoccus palaemonis]|uniref:Toxin-antitoxin system HicB family antitoxin n=1 Tax=Tessaracoccus palaemonis TaxID=2829499 RepID=A0ABX8SGX7_9ACTN|nr:toxin-antitoxin system HicB family antitoxin [Tessaracoccus palaemonis]QXT62525.1 toxin-antitoxin system HicB family antitoxin [Tessaracoccus palaemonis]